MAPRRPKQNAKSTVHDIVKKLKKYSVPKTKEGMARYGIETRHALGVSIPNISKIAKKIGTNHNLALQLWRTKMHEARILAAIIDDPCCVTEKQIESWVKDFHSWDLCDQCCGRLFDKTNFAYQKAFEWSERDEEFVKRAGFVLMAALAVHDKQAPDKNFRQFF